MARHIYVIFISVSRRKDRPTSTGQTYVLGKEGLAREETPGSFVLHMASYNKGKGNPNKHLPESKTFVDTSKNVKTSLSLNFFPVFRTHFLNHVNC